MGCFPSNIRRIRVWGRNWATSWRRWWWWWAEEKCTDVATNKTYGKAKSREPARITWRHFLEGLRGVINYTHTHAQRFTHIHIWRLSFDGRDVQRRTRHSNLSIYTVKVAPVVNSAISMKLLTDLRILFFLSYFITSLFIYFFLKCFSLVVTQFPWSMPWGTTYTATNQG